jgi:hypothetical protein
VNVKKKKCITEREKGLTTEEETETCMEPVRAYEDVLSQSLSCTAVRKEFSYRYWNDVYRLFVLVCRVHVHGEDLHKSVLPPSW